MATATGPPWLGQHLSSSSGYIFWAVASLLRSVLTGRNGRSFEFVTWSLTKSGRRSCPALASMRAARSLAARRWSFLTLSSFLLMAFIIPHRCKCNVNHYNLFYMTQHDLHITRAASASSTATSSGPVFASSSSSASLRFERCLINFHDNQDGRFSGVRGAWRALRGARGVLRCWGCNPTLA